VGLRTKLVSPEYANYLLSLSKYLTEFLRKTRPLDCLQAVQEGASGEQNANGDLINLVLGTTLPIELEFQETFEEEWNQGSLYGWEDALKKIRGQTDDANELAKESLFCQTCNKSFSSAGVYESHIKGKKHLKAAEKAKDQKSTSHNETFTKE